MLKEPSTGKLARQRPDSEDKGFADRQVSTQPEKFQEAVPGSAEPLLAIASCQAGMETFPVVVPPGSGEV